VHADIPPHSAQILKAQAEPPSFLGLGQPGQQIGDLLILMPQLRAIAKTGLADPKGPAGQGDADPCAEIFL
jgi:hypothetical protein